MIATPIETGTGAGAGLLGAETVARDDYGGRRTPPLRDHRHRQQ